MTIDDVRMLFAFNHWANERILAAVSELTADELTQPALDLSIAAGDAA